MYHQLYDSIVNFNSEFQKDLKTMYKKLMRDKDSLKIFENQPNMFKITSKNPSEIF